MVQWAQWAAQGMSHLSQGRGARRGRAQVAAGDRARWGLGIGASPQHVLEDLCLFSEPRLLQGPAMFTHL